MRDLLEGISDEEIHALCVEALRIWRRKHPNEGQFSLHGALGLEMLPLLLARKGRSPLDMDTLSGLKESFITEQSQPWFIGISDFVVWFTSSSYGNPISWEKQNVVAIRLTRRGMEFLDGDGGAISPSDYLQAEGKGVEREGDYVEGEVDTKAAAEERRGAIEPSMKGSTITADGTVQGGPARIDYLVLAPLAIERRALVDQVQSLNAEMRLDQERDEHHVTLDNHVGGRIYIVIKSLNEAGRVPAAIATQEALARLKPRAMMSVGIAGGIEGRTVLGDILVADQIIDASRRRAADTGDNVQSQVYRVSRSLLAVARGLGHAWVGRITTKPPGGVPPTPAVHFGPLVSTDTVITTVEYLTPLLNSFRNLIGADLESGGIAAAVDAHDGTVPLLVIRCVVDYMNERKNDDWRSHGAATAAAFAVALIQAAHRSGRRAEPAAAVAAPAVLDVATEREEGPSGYGTRLMRDTAGAKAWLNADEYAGALADVLADAAGEICFALLGHWGRGKTYLATLVDRKLPARHGRVWFSAWKYRSRPELWAHLHESFYAAQMHDSWWRRVPRLFRANLYKHGVLPLVVMFIGAGIAAVPLGSLFQLVLVLLGAIGAIRGALLFFKQRAPVAATLRRFLVVNRHIEKLGLQAAIGVDLESLVIGWAGRLQWSRARVVLSAVSYLVGVAALLSGLWLGFHPTGTPPIPGLSELTWYPPPVVVWTVIATVAGLAVALPVWLLSAGRDKKRLLLVVDDLDRMPSAEMLEIVESLKLFLENGAMRELVQLFLICEEEALRRALAEKYGETNRAVEENLQKLFIAHLRLPPLSPSEQEAVLTHIIGTVADPTPLVRGAAPDTAARPSPPQAATVAEHPTRVSAPDAPAAIADAPEFTDDDRRALQRGLRILGGPNSTWAALGPRAIQSYVLRYKLARRLLEARGARVLPQRLAVLLAERMHAGSDGASAGSEPIDAVIAEVA